MQWLNRRSDCAHRVFCSFVTLRYLQTTQLPRSAGGTTSALTRSWAVSSAAASAAANSATTSVALASAATPATAAAVTAENSSVALGPPTTACVTARSATRNEAAFSIALRKQACGTAERPTRRRMKGRIRVGLCTVLCGCAWNEGEGWKCGFRYGSGRAGSGESGDRKVFGSLCANLCRESARFCGPTHYTRTAGVKEEGSGHRLTARSSSLTARHTVRRPSDGNRATTSAATFCTTLHLQKLTRIVIRRWATEIWGIDGETISLPHGKGGALVVVLQCDVVSENINTAQ